MQQKSTKQLFVDYINQLEEFGVERLYWTLPKFQKQPQAKPKQKSSPIKPGGGSQVPSGVLDKPGMSPDKIGQLRLIEARVKVCTECGLHQGRNHTVFGAGSPDAELVLVGEAPGFEEDKQGIPFVGKAGQLLTRILEAMKLSREDVFICNVIKCHPPQNRNPEPNEVITCEPYLIEQLKVIRPKVICAMGKFAAQTLLQSTTPISRLRGKWHEYQGIPLMPTFHPAYLLRNPGGKRLVWDDMKQIMGRLGISVD